MATLSKSWIPIAKHTFLLLLLFLVVSTKGIAQSDVLSTKITPSEPELNLSSLVEILDEKYDIILSFNASLIDEDELRQVTIKEHRLDDLLNKLIDPTPYKLLSSGKRVTIVFVAADSDKERIKGSVFDRETGEPLIGVVVLNKTNGAGTFSNDFGYYSIPAQSGYNDLIYSYLGYDLYAIDSISSGLQNVYLSSRNKFDPVIILDHVSDSYDFNTSAYILDVGNESMDRYLTHNEDLGGLVRAHPHIQSGNEAQIGYVVHGGSPDQNLVLLDGIPVLEPGHTLGLGSIFISESLRDARLMTDGIPSRYGGRLSSILDTRLKMGNKNKFHGYIEGSLSELQAQLDGPIKKDKTTINIAARKSIYDLYLPQNISRFTTYDDISIDYHDFVVKAVHRFNTTNNIEAVFYDGDDRFYIAKEEDSDIGTESFYLQNSNVVKWGNTLGGLRFNNTVNNKIHLSSSISFSRFAHSSRGDYRFIHSDIDTLYANNNFRLKSDSRIKKTLADFNADYYHSTMHKFRIGVGWDRTDMSPSITQDLSQTGSIDTLPRTNYIFNTVNAYIEDIMQPSTKVLIYAGLRVSVYQHDHSLQYYQPRLKVTFTPNSRFSTSISYDHTVQFDHQIVNSGLGLPSDLWVPSTGSIRPEYSHLIAFDQDITWDKKWRLSSHAYYRYINHILDYSLPANIFFLDLNNSNEPVLTDSDAWKDNVVSGDGYAYGVGMQLRYEDERFAFSGSYHYGRQLRRFPSVLDGGWFYGSYDRPHDINIGANYKINSHHSIGLQFIHASGNRFSLALDGFDSVSGIELVSGLDRNNYRYPYFQRLNLYGRYHKPLGKGTFYVNYGIANVLNRFNAYYVYIYTNPLNDNRELRKLSLFPFIPKLSLGFKF